MSEFSFDDIVDEAQRPHLISAKQFRSVLPIGYVLQKHGISFSEISGKLSALCPFHADAEESFDVFGENLEFWGCHPCYGGLGGDVIDLIRAFEGLSTNETPRAIEIATSYLADMTTDGYTGPTQGQQRKQFDVQKAEKFVTRAWNEANIDLLDAFCQLKSLPFDGKYLHEVFGVGTWVDWIIIPYYDSEGKLAAYKRRTLTTKPNAKGGTQFDSLFYNHWRLSDDTNRSVVIAEGESDNWTVFHAVGEEFDVIGLPTGAGDIKEHKEPPQAHLLTGRKVVLAFDGDDSGRAARQAWYAALNSYQCEVYFAPVPDGKDMCTVENPAEIIRSATRTLVQAPTEIGINKGAGYVRFAKSENSENSKLSNWYFTPNRELVGDDGVAYEGHIEPGRNEAVLTSFDLKSKGRTIDWSTKQRRYWAGSDRDSQLILGLLQAQGPFIMSGRMSSIAGLNENHFVFPSGKIGPDYWKYVRPTSDVHLQTKIFLKADGEWDTQQVHSLRNLHKQTVMDPILAWLAIAPLRSLLNEFPPLSITGSSGTGKTTLTEAVVQTFTSSLIANNLTSTTKHALFAYLGCTNAFPVWFDEYRPGARKDAIITLEQIIRDAFTGQESSKGGLNRENWAEVVSVAMRAPLIVSGEDSFNEVSHTERMILIVLPMEGRNPDALREVRAWGDTGFAYNYLTWLQKGLMDNSLPEIVNYSTGPSELPARQRINMGVLELGWKLLTKFMNDHGDYLTDPDFSLIMNEAVEATKHDPIEDAIRWALNEDAAQHFLFSGDDPENPGTKILCIRVENFVSFIDRYANGIYRLPSGVVGIKRHLMNKYGAEERTVTHFMAAKEVLAIKHDRLEWI